jgi:hypothetical protein
MSVDRNDDPIRAFVSVDLDVARAPVPVEVMVPGEDPDDERRVSVLIGDTAVEVLLSGLPEDLRRWAQTVIRIADDLAIEADDLASDEGVEVEF